MEKESVLSMPDILPFPPVSPTCLSPSTKETRKELSQWWTQVLGIGSKSPIVRGLFALLSEPHAEDQASQGFSVLQTQWWLQHKIHLSNLALTRSATSLYQRQHSCRGQSSAELYLPGLKTDHSRLFDTLFAFVICRTMWTWGAWESCETSNRFLCLSYHRNAVTTSTEYGSCLAAHHQVNATNRKKKKTPSHRKKNAMHTNTTPLELQDIDPSAGFYIRY